MTRFRKSSPLFLAALLALPLAAQAGGVARLQAQSAADGRGGEFTIEFDDDGQARIAGGAGNGYLLVRGGRAYSVRDDGGTPVVHDLAQVAGLVRNSPLAGRRGEGGGRFGGRAPQFTGDLASFGDAKATGREETVAGLTGQVYLLDYTATDGRPRQVEMVISTAPQAREFSAAMRRIGQQMQAAFGKAAPAGARVLWDWLDRQQAGLLRLGDAVQVHELQDITPPTERFALPAAVTQVESLRDLRGLRGARR